MSRLAQLGVFCMVLGAVVLFLGLFPGAVNADVTPGIGLVQIIGILTGLVLLVLGAYVVTRALIHRNGRRTLMRDIGVRLGLTGMVFAAAVTLADAMGYGSHVGGSVHGGVGRLGQGRGRGLPGLGGRTHGMGARHPRDRRQRRRPAAGSGPRLCTAAPALQRGGLGGHARCAAEGGGYG